jgi:hypothetical protein
MNLKISVSGLIAHEHLYVFRKLKEGESKTKFKHSVKWWAVYAFTAAYLLESF